MSLEANLKVWIEHIQQGIISYSELTKLVHFCRAIAESYLSRYRASLVHLCSQHGLTVQDLAYDCIGPLFGRDEDGQFYHFQRFTNALYGTLEETAEQELFLAFKSFVLRVVKSQLARTYAQFDPDGARILRNIRDRVKKSSSCMELIEDFRGYVLQPKNCDPLNHLAVYPAEQLKQELLSCMDGAANIPQLLERLATILVEQEQYRRSLPLFEVVQIFKHFYHLANVGIEPELYCHDSNGITQVDIDDMKCDVLRTLKRKIISTYLLHDKITRKEAEILFATMCDIVSDWCQGDNNAKSLCEYLGRFVSVSQWEYEHHWRTKIEYLNRVARERIADWIATNI